MSVFYSVEKKFDVGVAHKNLRDVVDALAEAKITYWLTFGTLLGIVRDGDFIPYDFDIDIGCFKEQEVELLRIVSQIPGFEIIRITQSLISIIREGVYIDFYLFSSQAENTLNCCGYYILDLKLRQIDFDDYQVTVPEGSNALLRQWYGDDWVIPQKGVAAKPLTKSYWDKVYSDANVNGLGYSAFAEFCLPYMKSGKTLIDVGCGMGRDAEYFARNRLSVTAIDQSDAAIKLCSSNGIGVRYMVKSISQLKEMDCEDVDYIYMRFLLHAITKYEQGILLEWAGKVLSSGGMIFIEARSIRDEKKGKLINTDTYFSDHTRRYIRLADVEQGVASADFNIIYSIESKGLSVVKGEDPVLIRMVGRKR